ncbi:MAG: UDP-N-acetylglucosamine 2-epimerase (non-hydrolyzing) [Flavobacteriales bacterium]|nr:UDP-N-acetylglucosamine 2-epimerase (non-hydrolyzing) [Flavobacteriales bacterium]
MIRVCHVVGTRPNFVKAAPVIKALNRGTFKQFVVHTGQHYNKSLSEDFLQQLGFPPLDAHFTLHHSSSPEQTGEMIQQLGKSFKNLKPELVVLYGDVNSTLAGAIAASELDIAIAHVEAGLRSYDWRMKEERNRVIIDRLSQYLFLTEQSAFENLKKEGYEKTHQYFVGNTMIDSLLHFLPIAKALNTSWQLGLQNQKYSIVTMHRPSNVDDTERFFEKLSLLDSLSVVPTILFPIHPRVQHLERQMKERFTNITFTPSLPYLDFLSLLNGATFVITDSGGIQEETSFLGIPCFTIRPNTERPVTVESGTNILVKDIWQLPEVIEKRRNQGPCKTQIPLWDGYAAERIAQILKQIYH